MKYVTFITLFYVLITFEFMPAQQAITIIGLDKLCAIIPDFQVNESQGGTIPTMRGPICVDRFGNFVITWADRRNIYFDIYAQRFTLDGIPLDTNFRVNDNQDATIQWFPSISSDSSGNFVIAWKDGRNIDPGIYAQRYTNNGNPLGTNFRVNDDQYGYQDGRPSVSSAENGMFVITWRSERNGQPDIYAQRYYSNGSPIGTNFKVNDDQGNDNQYHPDISIAPNGNFVITWEDSRQGGDIFAQRFSSDGSLLNTNFIVNDDQGSEYQRFPSIAIDQGSNFVITWEDQRNGNLDIYAQRYSNDGNPLSTNFKVNNNQDS